MRASVEDHSEWMCTLNAAPDVGKFAEWHGSAMLLRRMMIAMRRAKLAPPPEVATTSEHALHAMHEDTM